MKNLLFLLMITMFCSCLDNKYLDNLHSPVKGESTEVSDKPETHIRLETNPNIYVGNIGYFEETGEFYLTVLPVMEMNAQKYYQIALKADLLIYKDAETTRQQLPINIAKQYFDLNFLNFLNVYDYSNSFITRLRFSRVEYYQSNIRSSYIAVFKPEKILTNTKARFYCVSQNASLTQSPVTGVPADSNNLIERIKTEMNIQQKRILAVRHIYNPGSGSIVSILSCDEKNKGLASSYLTEVKNDKLTLMNFYFEEFAFLDILQLPLEINGRPVFLLTLGIPDTEEDKISAPLVYDGNVYWLTKGNKIHQ